MTLPEEIADLAGKLHEVCKRYKVRSITLTQYQSEKTESQNQFSVDVAHPLGKLEIPHPGYFSMPKDVGKIAPALTRAIAVLVDRYKGELKIAQSDLRTAEDAIARCKDSIETASSLDPGVLDRIVMAIEEG